MINKIKSKLNAFRWYLNNQQAGNIQQAVHSELKEWHQVVTAKRSGDIAKELMDEFYKGVERMTEKRLTVEDLYLELDELIERGYGKHTVELSVNYDHCDHIQPLKEVYVCKDCKHIDWITLRGKAE